MNIRLIPLEKIIVDEKEIHLGEKKEAVISMLGAPEMRRPLFIIHDYAFRNHPFQLASSSSTSFSVSKTSSMVGLSMKRQFSIQYWIICVISG